MQQRQLRLGDILDDYCPRERRVTNHAVVAMVGQDVMQTRCTTCDAEHEYKHARVPRQRRKPDAPAALYAHVLANGPKRVSHDANPSDDAPIEAELHETDVDAGHHESAESLGASAPAVDVADLHEPSDDDRVASDDDRDADARERDDDVEEGPVHRPLIRATLPRTEGQPPPQRPAPDFTIRQPGGRGGRFRGRHGQGGGAQFQGNRSGNVAGPHRGGSGRHGGRQPMSPMSRPSNRQGSGRKRSK